MLFIEINRCISNTSRIWCSTNGPKLPSAHLIITINNIREGNASASITAVVHSDDRICFSTPSTLKWHDYLDRCDHLEIFSEQVSFTVDKSEIESRLQPGESIEDFHTESSNLSSERVMDMDPEELDLFMLQEMP